MNNKTDNFKKRLIYRSQYRGTKEMDKLIGSFVKLNIDNLSLVQLKELEKFLEIDDDILYKFYNDEAVEINLSNSKILELFRNFHYNK